MEPVDRPAIHRRMEPARVVRLVGALMPYAQAMLVDWQYDQAVEDGTIVGTYRHAWTREYFHLTDDGRLFEEVDGHLIESGSAEETVRRIAPMARHWLDLGGYGPGDILGPSIPDDEELAF